MSDWKAKRFWKEASVSSEDGGFGVRLDGRPLRTPAKAVLLVPSRGMAAAIAAEWDAQSDRINPESMPVTRGANAAIDKVANQRREVADMLAAYGDSDLLCYRADAPQSLVDLQAETWDPLLDWAETALGARLQARTGVIHAPQVSDALKALSDHTHRLTNFELAGFHDLVALSGSLILGFAVFHRQSPVGEIWKKSQLDEQWQAERWGADEEAEILAETKRQAFVNAALFIELLSH
jgi:chaperone required for assembly of F1-ATPase